MHNLSGRFFFWPGYSSACTSLLLLYYRYSAKRKKWPKTQITGILHALNQGCAFKDGLTWCGCRWWKAAEFDDTLNDRFFQAAPESETQIWAVNQWQKKNSVTVNPEYFVRTKFSYVRDLRPFVRMIFSHSWWPLRILWLALSFSYAFFILYGSRGVRNIRNKMHTKYSGFRSLKLFHGKQASENNGTCSQSFAPNRLRGEQIGALFESQSFCIVVVDFGSLKDLCGRKIAIGQSCSAVVLGSSLGAQQKRTHANLS